MIINATKTTPGVEINTPLDDPTQFSPSWRAELGAALSLNPRMRRQKEYSQYYKDKYVLDYAEFLRKVDKAEKCPNTPMGYAFKWFHQSSAVDTKYRLEPLLLTTVPFSVISEALAGGDIAEEAFKIYERLFFNIRDDKGELNKSCHLRMYFALPNEEDVIHPQDMDIKNLWRLVGAQGGYRTLCRLWMWYDAPGFNDKESVHLPEEAWWMTQSTMLSRMARGIVSNFDLVSWIGKFTDNERLRMDSSRGDGEGDRMAEAMLNLLKYAAPKVLEVSRTVDEEAAINAKIAEKRSSATLRKDELTDNADAGKVDINDHLQQIFTQK